MYIIHNDLIGRFTVNCARSAYALIYIKRWIKPVQPNVIIEERGKKIIQFLLKQIKGQNFIVFIISYFKNLTYSNIVKYVGLKRHNTSTKKQFYVMYNWGCFRCVVIQYYSCCTKVGNLIVSTIYLQLIRNRYMFRSFTVFQCSHQHCVQPVASDVQV